MKKTLKETYERMFGSLVNEVSSKLMKTIKQTIDRESAMDIEDLVMSLNIDNKYYSDIGRYLDNIRDEEQGIKPSGFSKSSNGVSASLSSIKSTFSSNSESSSSCP